MLKKNVFVASAVLLGVVALPVLAQNKSTLRIQNHQAQESTQGRLIAEFVEKFT